MNTISNPIYYEILPDPMRRELGGQLSVFKSALDNWSHQDQLTIDLRNWLEDFKRDLRQNDASQVQDEYIGRLQNLLVDPMTNYPLDDGSLLGNDGYTYNKKALLIHLSSFPLNAFRYYSPMLEANQAPFPFTVVKHEIVILMVEWLSEKNAFHPDADLEEAYLGLVNLPTLPTLDHIEMCDVMENIERKASERNLKRKLMEFGILLRSSPLQDQTTENLRNWHRQFTEILLSPNIYTEEIKDQCIEHLQDILMDPISLNILERETFLGSDGLTYSKKSLTIRLSETPALYRNRSPFFLNREVEFSLQPHPVVSSMIEWLVQIDRHNPSDAIEERYRVLDLDGELPMLPTVENLRNQRINQQVVEQNRQADENLQAFEEIFLAQLLAQIDTSFNEVHQEIDANSELIQERINEVFQNDQEQLQQIQQSIERLDQEEHVFQERAETLQEEINSLGNKMTAAERKNKELKVAINQTRAAIKKRNKAFAKNLLITAAIIAACATGTLALGGLAMMTATKNGIMIGVTIAL